MVQTLLGNKIEDYGVGGNILHEMKNDEVHKNVNIKTTDGSIIKAHSVVLAAVSPKFKSVFEERSFGIYNLTTSNVSSNTWQKLLDFLYTGFLQLPNVQHEFDELTTACEALDFIPLLTHLKASDFDTEDEDVTFGQAPNANIDYECDICHISFSSSMALNSHRGHHARKNSNEEHKCDVCLLSYSSGKALQRHMTKHSNKQGYSLDNGTEETESVYSFNKVEDEEKKFECDTCGAFLPSLKALSSHKGHHRRSSSFKQITSPVPPPASKPADFFCSICDKTFGSAPAFGSHNRIHANNRTPSIEKSPEPKTQPNPWICDICHVGFATYKSLHAHRGHHSRSQSSLNQSVINQPTVNQSSVNQATVNQSSGNQTSEKAVRNGVVSCDKCGQEFTSLKSLQSHLAYHKRTGPQCSYCSIKCLNAISLQRHLKRCHKIDDSLPDTVEQVPRVKGRGIVKVKQRFYKRAMQKKRIKNLIKGRAQVSNSNELECPVCSMIFSLPHLLRLHLKKQHSTIRHWRTMAAKKKMKKALLPPFWGDYIEKKCKHCDIVIEKAGLVVKHLTDVHSETHPYKCKLCDQTYTARMGLRSHILQRHATQWRLYHCDYCNYSSDTLLLAQRHHKTKHGEHPTPAILLDEDNYEDVDEVADNMVDGQTEIIEEEEHEENNMEEDDVLEHNDSNQDIEQDKDDNVDQTE